MEKLGSRPRLQHKLLCAGLSWVAGEKENVQNELRTYVSSRPTGKGYSCVLAHQELVLKDSGFFPMARTKVIYPANSEY